MVEKRLFDTRTDGSTFGRCSKRSTVQRTRSPSENKFRAPVYDFLIWRSKIVCSRSSWIIELALSLVKMSTLSDDTLRKVYIQFQVFLVFSDIYLVFGRSWFRFNKPPSSHNVLLTLLNSKLLRKIASGEFSSSPLMKSKVLREMSTSIRVLEKCAPRTVLWQDHSFILL